MKAIVTVGISGSGKTTWAEKFCRENGYININRDNVRFSIFGSTDWGNYKFTNAKEKLVTEICDGILVSTKDSGKNVVVSDTNLSAKYRDKLITRLRSFGYEVEVKEFPISWEEACKRDSSRTMGVGKTVLYRQWKQWLDYTGYTTYVPTGLKPDALICDIDGTLANMTGNCNFCKK